ncbi:MAG: TraR/DksA family transcriptional regulator [Gammaproteobacteria bacterium]|nr:TraR/DksA family transcriptional regulator [Gammaproteobacteria bacterium]
MTTQGGEASFSEIRERLLAERARLLERVRGLDDNVHHRLEPLPADFAEQAVELENQEVMEALDEDARGSIDGEDALARLEEGTYGECTRCGEDINPERLAALPSPAAACRCTSQSRNEAGTPARGSGVEAVAKGWNEVAWPAVRPLAVQNPGAPGEGPAPEGAGRPLSQEPTDTPEPGVADPLRQRLSGTASPPPPDPR